MNKKNNRKKILYNSIVPLIGIAVIAVILIVSTVVLNGYADKSAEDSIISLGEFYLNEITTRNVDEVRLCFNEKVYDMKKAISELRVDYLKDEKSLQWYISMVQNINGMDMFAVVDSKGKIYAADETLQDEQKFDFLKQDINEITISTIYELKFFFSTSFLRISSGESPQAIKNNAQSAPKISFFILSSFR